MAGIKYKGSDGQWHLIQNVMVNAIDVVQTSGTSSADVMSQSAVTNYITVIDGNLVTHTSNDDIHLSSTEKRNLDSLADNIATISGITSSKISDWDAAATSAHSHTNKSYIDTVSGNVGTMAYENVNSYSSATEVNTALGEKADNASFTGHTADTNVHFSGNEKANLDSLATNIAAISGISSTKVDNWDAAYGDKHSHSNKSALDAITGNVGTMAYENTSSYSSATDISTALNAYADSVKYNSDSHYVEFYHGTTAGTKVFEYDASPFIIDGMVESVAITTVTSGSSEIEVLEVKWNSAAGSQVTDIPLSEIFDPSNYYTKSETSGATEIGLALGNKADSSAFTAHTADSTVHITASERTKWNKVDDKQDTSGMTAYTLTSVTSTLSGTVTGHTANTNIHLTTTEKTNIDALATNIAAISGITSTKVGNWDTAYTNNHAHSNKTYLDGITGSVGTMIYQNSSSYSSATEVNSALALKGDKSDVDDLIAQSEVIAASLNDLNERKYDASGITNYTTTATTSALNNVVTGHTANTTIHLTSTEKGQLHTHANKTYLDGITGTVGTMVYQNASSYSSATQVSTALGGKVDNTTFNTFSSATNTSINDLSGQSKTVAAALNDLDLRVEQLVITDGGFIGGGYAVCDTASNNGAKTVVLDSYQLIPNIPVSILFTHAFELSEPTLNINGAGAKPIKMYGNTLPTGVVRDNTILTMVYDGTAYNVISVESYFAPSISGAVDMGLPSGVLWCDRNVGASAPEGQGYFFSWGNVSGHCLDGASDYDFGTGNDTEPYKSSSGATLTGNIAVGNDYDMARFNMGAPWRLPTRLEYQELYDNSNCVWTTQNSVAGRLFTSKINGNSLFFPAAGFYNGTSHNGVGSYGYYWSSSLYSAAYAFNLHCSSSAVYPQHFNYRFYGFSARAVQ